MQLANRLEGFQRKDIFALRMEPNESLMDFTEKLPGKTLEGDQERNNRIINSAIAYMAAFAIVYVSFFVITALFARKNHLLHKLYFFKVEFVGNWDYWQYDPVLSTFRAAPIFCLLAGVFFLWFQRFYRKKPGILKLFFLWLGVHYINFFCTQLVLLPLRANSQGEQASYLGVVALYLRLEDFSKIIFSIVASLIMIIVGVIVAKPFIQITNSTQNIYRNENRIVYLFQTVFLPYVICSGVSLIYFSDGSFILNLSLVVTMLIIIISLFINGMKNRMIMIYRLPETGQIENKFLIGLSATLILMKILLNNGVKF